MQNLWKKAKGSVPGIAKKKEANKRKKEVKKRGVDKMVREVEVYKLQPNRTIP